ERGHEVRLDHRSPRSERPPEPGGLLPQREGRRPPLDAQRFDLLRELGGRWSVEEHPHRPARLADAPPEPRKEQIQAALPAWGEVGQDDQARSHRPVPQRTGASAASPGSGWAGRTGANAGRCRRKSFSTRSTRMPCACRTITYARLKTTASEPTGNS